MSSSSNNSLESVKPYVDLVIFSNVLPAYSTSGNITANYILGDDVLASTWDWIGIFDRKWKGLGEYLVYNWTTVTALDCNSPRKRSISIPSNVHRLQPDPNREFQLLYVSRGNDVIGVSTPFRIETELEEEDLALNKLFEEKQHATAGPSCLNDTFEVVNEHTHNYVPVSRKKKITTVYKDHDTLTPNFVTSTTWSDALRIVDVHPVVKEYIRDDTKDVVQPLSPLPVYDASWKGKSTSKTKMIPKERKITKDEESIIGQLDFKEMFPRLEFPARLSILPGPETFNLAAQDSRSACSGCQVAKVLICDLVEKSDTNEEKIKDLEKLLNALQKNNKEETVQTESSEALGDNIELMDWFLQSFQEDNKSLREKVENLERRLAAEKAQNLRDGRLLQLPKPDSEGWSVKEPKRIVRLQKTVCRQDRNLCYLRDCVLKKDARITKLKEEKLKLRQQLREEKKKCRTQKKLAMELDSRIKQILLARSKAIFNAWRPLKKTIKKKPSVTSSTASCSTCSTGSGSETPKSAESQSDQRPPKQSKPSKKKPSVTSSTASCSSTGSGSETPKSAESQSDQGTPKEPKGLKGTKIKNKQIAKVLKSEKPQKPKLHKEKAQEEQCPTCGLKFSKRADPRAIEEHMTFHDRFRL